MTVLYVTCHVLRRVSRIGFLLPSLRFEIRVILENDRLASKAYVPTQNDS